MKYKLFILSLTIFIFSCRLTKRSTQDNKFIVYTPNCNDTILIPKCHAADIIYKLDVLQNGTLVYYSKTTDSLSFYNPNTKALVRHKVIPNSPSKGVNVDLTETDDSNVIVCFKNYSPFHDNNIYTLNWKTGERKNNYLIKSKNIITSDILPFDSFEAALYLSLKKDLIMPMTGPFFNHKDSTIYLSLAAGQSMKKIARYKPFMPGMISISRNKTENEIIDITFNETNTVFKDYIPNISDITLFNFVPRIALISNESFLADFTFANSFIKYNCNSKKKELIPCIPSFLDPNPLFSISIKTKEIAKVYAAQYALFTDLNSKFIYREMNIPYLLVKNKDTIIANTRRLILYDKNPEIKASGIVNEDLIGWHVGHLNDTVYTLDIERSAMDRSNFILYRYTFSKKSEEIGYYKPNNSFDVNDKFGDYTGYITELDASLTNLDTIALLPTYSACGTCADLLGSFLNTIQTNNLTSKPFIMVNSNVFQGENFFKTLILQHKIILCKILALK